MRAVTTAAPAFAACHIERDDDGMDSELRAELLRRAEQDQAARLGVIGQRGDCEMNCETVFSVDADNVAWLKNVVAEVGWPGWSMAGEDGAHAAWLLAQHADRDPAFQRRCLDLITEAVEHGEASPVELAYLTDRVLLAEGQPQEYGTQAEGREDGYVPRRLRDPEHVDERRAHSSSARTDQPRLTDRRFDCAGSPPCRPQRPRQQVVENQGRLSP